MMAAADINTAQVSLQCGLCNQPFHRFCNTYQLGLCEDCIGKHVSLPLRLHVIVPYINRREQNVCPRCIHHPYQTFEAYCQHCDVPICIKKETEEITNLIYINGTAKFKVIRKNFQFNSHFSDLLRKAEYHGKQWYLEVNLISTILNL